MLRIWYHAEARQRGQRSIDLARRRETFDEVVGGLEPDGGALRGAALPVVRQLLRVRRMLLRRARRGGDRSSGPGMRYEYDLDKCTGCAICYDQCPCGAITMVPEQDAAGRSTADAA